MKLYRLNIIKLGVSLLPWFFRTNTIVAFTRITLSPFQGVHDLFFLSRDKNIYKVKHNGQVCKLRKVLNDAFPSKSKSFEIVDALGLGKWRYAYDDSELYLQLMVPDDGGVMIWSEDVMSRYADFTVRIPSDLNSTDNMNIIRSLVNEYKLTSKKPVYELY